jgi:hypothetical protein
MDGALRRELKAAVDLRMRQRLESNPKSRCSECGKFIFDAQPSETTRGCKTCLQRKLKWTAAAGPVEG